jgi:hypothetical protein
MASRGDFCLFMSGIPYRFGCQKSFESRLEGEMVSIIAKTRQAIDTLLDFASGKANEFNNKAKSTSGNRTVGLVDKLYRHPFTVSNSANKKFRFE